MKTFLRTAICFLLPLALFAQTPDDGSYAPYASALSPFYHLSDLLVTAAPPFQCPLIKYYNSTANVYTYTESLPVSSAWAIKASPPQTAAKACTVWTVTYHFDLQGASPNQHDTVKIFVREGNSPGQNIFQTWHLARGGLNQGEVEIDPPAVPPYNIRPILRPPRDVYVGMYLVGDSAHTVEWTFRTPSSYTSPPRSYKYTSPGSIIPASTALGHSVDWEFAVRFCCDFVIPIELSLLTGSCDGARIHLVWRTESETNNFGFEIQRAESGDGPWESRGSVPGNGTTTNSRWYDFTDSMPPGRGPDAPPVVWYRLLQRDFDGTMSVTPAIQVALTRPEDAGGFRLYPIYPNPVLSAGNGSVKIRYQIPAESRVRITVHNSVGREVATVADYVHSPGVHEAMWYPYTGQENLKSGCYFIRMEAGNVTDIQRITIVR